jgi:DNA-directed RNA polymerase subunit RPC12/RpoP
MALIKCPECGREVSDQATACPQCGYPIRKIEVDKRVLQEESTSETNSVPVADGSPFLGGWQTNAGMTVFGVIVCLILSRLFYMDTQGDITSGIVVIVIGLVYAAFQIIYAAAIYPSLFGPNPHARSDKSISFANGLFGSFIWGPIWNSNLTKRKKASRISSISS